MVLFTLNIWDDSDFFWEINNKISQFQYSIYTLCLKKSTNSGNPTFNIVTHGYVSVCVLEETRIAEGAGHLLGIWVAKKSGRGDRRLSFSRRFPYIKFAPHMLSQDVYVRTDWVISFVVQVGLDVSRRLFSKQVWTSSDKWSQAEIVRSNFP